MPISLSTLRQAAGSRKVAKSLHEARAAGAKTLFLCHSHEDQDLVLGLVNLLDDAGWNVYVDWKDTSMPAAPSRETAQKIKDRVKGADYFLFLATPNSVKSRWCPWEIGFADGVKPITSIFVSTTRDEFGNHYGNEYLQLYRHVDFSDKRELGVWMPGEAQGYRLRDI
jgi:hypothetical protein